MNFNEIFGENVTYENLKNHQKTDFQPVSRACLWKNQKKGWTNSQYLAETLNSLFIKNLKNADAILAF